MTRHNYQDLGDDLRITKITERHVGGTWVTGILNGHRFEALVFPEHAEFEEYELGKSRISKLWIQDLATKRTVYNFDRGDDIPAANDAVSQIIEYLADGLACFLHNK